MPVTPTFHPSCMLLCPALPGGLEQPVWNKDTTLYSITSTTFGWGWARLHRLWILEFKASFEVISPNLFIFPEEKT